MKLVQRLKGMTVGLIGFDRIGRMVARKLSGFQFRIMVYGPYVEEALVVQYGVEFVDFQTLVGESEFLSLHVPLYEETKHMIDKSGFGMMHKKPFIINAGRGGLIREEDLVTALDQRIRGVALDVMETEPILLSHPLQSYENLILTPHVAWYSEEALSAIQLFAAKEVERVLKGFGSKNLINQQIENSDALRKI